MKLYLMAKPLGVVVNPHTFEPNLKVKYTIELTSVNHDPIQLSRWLRLIHGTVHHPALTGEFQSYDRISTHDKLVLNPIDEIVPWLVRGLKDAVLFNATQQLALIVDLVKLSGIQNPELDIIERSLSLS